MSLASGQPPRPGDPGGPGGGYRSPSNIMNGDYTGARLPSFMDRDGTAGPLQYLKMETTSGIMPQDPFMLRLSMEKYLNAPIDGAFKENQGTSYVLKVRSQSQFTKLCKMTKLADGTEVKISEHPQLNQRQCVVSCYDSVILDDAYLNQQLETQGVKDLCRIRRRKPDGSFENTPTMILTSSGTVIPPHVDFGWFRCRTRSYYPSPMQCYRCWSFGHTGKRCTEPFRVCGRCSKVHEEDRIHVSEEATSNQIGTDRPLCTDAIFCKNCKVNDHSASGRKCPVFEKEVAIQHIRIDQGMSYPQAHREYDARSGGNQNLNAYSTVVGASKDAEIEELKAIVTQLQLDSRKKHERVQEMEKALQTRIFSERLETVREHGTIEELIRQVAQLTATVQSLQAELSKKDRMIEKLLSTAHRSPSENVAQEMPVDDDNFLSQSSNDEPPTANPNLDQIATQSITNWIESNTRQRHPNKKVARKTVCNL